MKLTCVQWAHFRFLAAKDTFLITNRMLGKEIELNWWNYSSLHATRRFEYPWAYMAMGPYTAEHRVLDVGGGLTLFGMLIAPSVQRFETVDILESAVSEMKLFEAKTGIHPVLGDARQLPFPDGYFDRACSISVLEHMPRLETTATIDEMQRVTKSDGKVALTLDVSMTPNGEIDLDDAKRLVNHYGMELPEMPKDAIIMTVAPHFNEFGVLCMLFEGQA